MEFGANPVVGSGGDFLKLKDKEQVVGVFRGKPLEYTAKWNGTKTVKCEPTEKGASFRFRVAILVKEGEQYVAKIWEQGATVYNLLKTLNADYPLETTALKITRSGSTMNDTAYTIIPVPNGAITPEKDLQLKAVALPELWDGLDAPGLAPSTQAQQSEELPF